MKRIWIAAAFILIVISLCVFSMAVVKSTYISVTQSLNAAEAQLEKNDFKSLEKTTASLEKLWSRRYRALSLFIEHGELDELSVTLNTLARYSSLADEEQTREKIIESRSKINAFYNSQKLTPGNIF